MCVCLQLCIYVKKYSIQYMSMGIHHDAYMYVFFTKLHGGKMCMFACISIHVYVYVCMRMNNIYMHIGLSIRFIVCVFT